MQTAKSTYTMSPWRWLAAIIVVVLAALLYVWPARRNFYGHLDGIDVRLLFVDSTGDEPVCLDGFRKMRSRLADAGSKARFIELDGLGHNELIVRVGMTTDPITPLVTEFLGAVAR